MNGIQEVPMSGDAPSVNPTIGIEKRCSRCGEIKPLDSFYKRNEKKNHWRQECKDCIKIQRRDYYKRNSCKILLRASGKDRDKENERMRLWRKNHPEMAKEHRRKSYLIHAEKRRAEGRKQYWDNPEKSKKKTREWKINNIDRSRYHARKYMAKKLEGVNGRMNNNMAKSIRNSLKGKKNGRHWETLVGYTTEQLKAHLEKQFKEGMSWENHGTWHIDHKIPISAFNFEKPEDEDFRRCWALSNLQPLWAKENLSKQNRLAKHFQPSIIFK